MDFMVEFQHLKIQFEEIKSATNNFDEHNVIGKGGFGKVYGGTIPHSKGRSVAAFKRLDRRYGQGSPEFWKEVMMLSRYTHENLISLLGFCDMDGEKILVYEYAARGSLDRHLSDTALRWTQRLKICVAAAKGLAYLHDHRGTQQRLVHRDIKSSNILLDEDWNAKISDFGLSKIGPANQEYSYLVTNVVGTFGYCDPQYMENYFLTKESDVYSFGVVLFEVLCGRLCFESTNGDLHTLVPMWKHLYETQKLDEIIFQDLMQQMELTSLEAFSDIAYQCLQKSREERPTMAHVVEKLEITLKHQEKDDMKRLKDLEEIIKAVVPPSIYRSDQEKLSMLLSKGILLNAGKTWFSTNKNRENCETISAACACLSSASDRNRYVSVKNSRFAPGNCYVAFDGKFKMHIKTQFLSPQTTYTVSLVFRFLYDKDDMSEISYTALKYKLEGDTESSIVYLGERREDGWLIAELYQFTSDIRNINLEILFEGTRDHGSLLVEAIEFRPLQKVEDEKVDMPIWLSNIDDIDWEQKLPNDYQEIIKWSKHRLQWTTKFRLYLLLHKGFQIKNGEGWFFLDANEKKCYMLPAKMALVEEEWIWRSLPESRFGKVTSATSDTFNIVCKIKSQMLSSHTRYASYLVYKVTKGRCNLEVPLEGKVLNAWKKTEFWYIYLVGPQTPVIRRKTHQSTQNHLNQQKVKGINPQPSEDMEVVDNIRVPSNRPVIKGIPRPRNDGCMEVQVWEFQTGTSTTTKEIPMHVEFHTLSGEWLDYFMIEGIEFRPL